jgi:hypothetical protein
VRQVPKSLQGLPPINRFAKTSIVFFGPGSGEFSRVPDGRRALERGVPCLIPDDCREEFFRSDARFNSLNAR